MGSSGVVRTPQHSSGGVGPLSFLEMVRGLEIFRCVEVRAGARSNDHRPKWLSRQNLVGVRLLLRTAGVHWQTILLDNGKKALARPPFPRGGGVRAKAEMRFLMCFFWLTLFQ